MGPEGDPNSVVDNQLMIHGIDGIRVMDASAMPSIVSGNTHATIVMMAERGVNFIKKRWLVNTLTNRGGFVNSPVGHSNAYVLTQAVTLKPQYQYTVKPQKNSFQQISYTNQYYNFKPKQYYNNQYNGYQQESNQQTVPYVFHGVLNTEFNVK